MSRERASHDAVAAERGRADTVPSRTGKILVVGAAMLALFLGALDALVVSSAMPTIVGELGGVHLYSWVFSAYLLTRTISLPIFGKLCDLFDSKKLYTVAIATFIISSAFAGAAHNMAQLIASRAVQGIGAGGTFALAYTVISDLSTPGKRGKMMGLISFVWGIASILGPPMGGLIVSYFSWSWIFYMNIPLGMLALLGIAVCLKDVREKKANASIDFLGTITLSASVLALLIAFLAAGRSHAWLSPEIGGMLALSLLSGAGFCYAEKRAKEPLLSLEFFKNRSFSLANGSAFFSSFAIFSLSAFSPLFIQGALGRDPAELGLAMVPLSLGWSVGAFACGQVVNRSREKFFSIIGSFILMASTGLTLTFDTSTPLVLYSSILAMAGIGMGVVSIPTLLIVQNSLDPLHLGVATSSQQFARTLGGTIGIGISGGLVTSPLMKALDALMNSPLSSEIPRSLSEHLSQSAESLFQPDVQRILSPEIQRSLQAAVENGVDMVFWASLAASGVALLFCYLLPPETKV